MKRNTSTAASRHEVKIGDWIKNVERADGERIVGYGKDPDIRWLNGGTLGVVVELREGYPRHHCPNHSAEYPDCICHSESGYVSEMMPYAVVAWQTENGALERCIDYDERGDKWEMNEVA